MSATLQALGLDSSTADFLQSVPHDLVPGRVARVDKGLATVLTEDGPVRATWSGAILAAMAGDAQAGPCTGDWAVLRFWPDERITLESLAPRRSAIVRAEVSGTSKGQVLAANVDVIAIVVGLHPEPNIGRIERFLALAWESGARPVVVLTKADLVGDADAVAEDVANAAPGADVLVCSATTGDGLEAVRSLLDGNATMALLGSSGAGKSSLVNALAGVELLDVQDIRDDGKGRHTSVRRELIVLPTGGIVIDTPGLRGIGLQESGRGWQLRSRTSRRWPSSASSRTARTSQSQTARSRRPWRTGRSRSVATRAGRSCSARPRSWPAATTSASAPRPRNSGRVPPSRTVGT